MKKLINISLIALAFTIIGTIDAKIMKRRTNTIPVTKNEKQMFVDTKALKNASNSTEKMNAAEKLAADIKSNPNTRLILAEQGLLQEIKRLEDKIASEASYISYFDAEEVQEDKELLELLYHDLAEIQTQLKKAITTRPQAISALNYWSVRALIGAVGLATAYLLVNNRAAVMSAASTVGSKIGSAASTAWNYAPSVSSLTSSWAGTTAMQIAQGAVISVITSKVAQQIMQLLEMNETNPTLTQEEVDRLRKALAQYEQQQSQK